MESPQKFVQYYKLPQIPVLSRVYDTPLNEEKADPISLSDIMGSVLIYLGGMAISCGFFMFEYSKTVVQSIS